jgi:hypothetical protein
MATMRIRIRKVSGEEKETETNPKVMSAAVPRIA